MFCKKSVFWSLSRSEPSFQRWSRSQKKNIWSRSRGKWFRYVTLKKTYPICLGQFGRVGTTGVNAFLLCMTMTDTEMLEKTACRSNNKKLVLSVFVEAFNGGLTWQVVGGGRREKDSRFGSQPLIVPDSYQAKNERADK